MRREWRWLASAAAAMVLGFYVAESYVQILMPLYRWGAEWLIDGKPWQINSIAIHGNEENTRRELWMTSELKVHSWDPQPSAQVVARLQLGSLVQNAVVYWLLLICMPTRSMRGRLSLLALGVPVFVVLEVATTSCQLVSSMVQAAAMLEGEADPLTWPERWSRFLESGGRLVIEMCAALSCVSLLALWERRRPAFIRHRLAA